MNELGAPLPVDAKHPRDRSICSIATRSTTCATSRSVRMIGAGYGRECNGDVQWLESKIRHWIRAVRAVFASEWRLCELVFEGRADAPFGEAVKGAALQLFGFAEAGLSQRRRKQRRALLLTPPPRTSYLAPMERRRHRLAVLCAHLRPTQLSASLCRGDDYFAAAAGEIIVKYKDKR